MRTSQVSARRLVLCFAAVCVLAGCGARETAGSAGAQALAASAAPKTPAQRGFTGVWMPTGTLENPAGVSQWPNTPWPKNPPFTPAGAAESQRLNDHGNFTACAPG